MTEVTRMRWLVFQINCQTLVEFRDLLSQIPASAVNNQVPGAVLRFIDLNKMIAASQRAQAALQTPCVLQAAVASQLLQVICSNLR